MMKVRVRSAKITQGHAAMHGRSKQNPGSSFLIASPVMTIKGEKIKHTEELNAQDKTSN
jgi:hypothetical protein